MNARRRFKAQSSSDSVPVPAIVGPILGLMYILIFPFVVFGTLARAGVSWAVRNIPEMWRRLGHVHLV
ncbi:MAG: hypothetical protein HYX92_10100 [Chloroflexi bacterium]|nr:hypothetical protein [Chloroflexota bacterium]